MVRKKKNGNNINNTHDSQYKRGYWWEARSSVVKAQDRDEISKPSNGRRPKYSSPEILWESCCEYFKWVENNPIYTHQVIAYKGQGSLVKVPKPRAMTISGLALFLGIHVETWGRYRNGKDVAIRCVCRSAEQVIRDQKFSGAAADLFNASIIARDLGLKEGLEHSGPGGGPIEMARAVDPSKLSDEELARLVDTLDKAQKEE
jgi:hypothetical protein